MNSKYILAIIVLGLGLWWFTSRGQQSEMTTQNTESMPAENQTIRDLLTSGDPVTCDYTASTEAASTTGSIYISAERMRGDFTTTNGTTSTSHMIFMNNTTYVWDDNEPTGYMMGAIDSTMEEGSEDAMEEESMDKPDSTSQNPVNLDDPIDYSCSAWEVDESMFELPNGVNFVDIKSMMENSKDKIIESNQ